MYLFLGQNIVITGCRGGTIKLWSTESCSLVGEMKGSQILHIKVTTTLNFLLILKPLEVSSFLRMVFLSLVVVVWI